MVTHEASEQIEENLAILSACIDGIIFGNLQAGPGPEQAAVGLQHQFGRLSKSIEVAFRPKEAIAKPGE
jgi:hypothetical protein